MNKQEFTDFLKNIDLSKKDFAELSNISYNTVNNWNDTSKPVPPWVKSWLDNYVKAKENEKIRLALKPLVDIELRKKEISNLLDTLLQMDMPRLISIFLKEAPTIANRLSIWHERGVKISKKDLAYELEGLTMAPSGTYEYTFKKIKEITGILLESSDTDLFLDFLK